MSRRVRASMVMGRGWSTTTLPNLGALKCFRFFPFQAWYSLNVSPSGTSLPHSSRCRSTQRNSSRNPALSISARRLAKLAARTLFLHRDQCAEHRKLGLKWRHILPATDRARLGLPVHHGGEYGHVHEPALHVVVAPALDVQRSARLPGTRIDGSEVRLDGFTERRQHRRDARLPIRRAGQDRG